MDFIHDFLVHLDGFISGGEWFVFLLLGTGLFFTIYLKFPQIRYFKHAIRIVRGKYDKSTDKGDTTHFQALTTALSGTVGTGNIAGVAFAIHLGGPAALFWMLVTAFLGMCSKFVEVTLSHKYRQFEEDGTVSGGPMYFMRERLNITTKSGKTIKTGYWLGGFFAVATVISSFGTGSLPQINSISSSLFATFGIEPVVSGGVLAVLLGLVIIGGIKRIAKVTSRLVPFMAIIYFIGAFAVIITNFSQIIPSIGAVFADIFTGTAAAGGFLGAGFAFAFNRGVNRGLFSNEAGQGSAPIAHASAKAHEPVSEGMVAILEPFIDTIIICFITGLTLLSSGVWNQKIENDFQMADMEILVGHFDDSKGADQKALYSHIANENRLQTYNGDIAIAGGKFVGDITIINARSVADDVRVFVNDQPYSGNIEVQNGKPINADVIFRGKSLLHSAPLTAEAFKHSFFGDFGKYIVSIGLLLFAFSTAISWSYYGDRAITYLVGTKWVMLFRMVYVVGFFLASFVDTTIIWVLSGLTVAFMTIPNLIGLLLLRKEIKSTINDYWIDFKKEHPQEQIPE